MENNQQINSFILSTSIDYDIDYDTVERYYRAYGNDTSLFYSKLEDFIETRSQLN